MPRIKLTQLAANRINPPATESQTHWDSQLPGFGLRVSPKGRKTWIAMYRVNGKAVMETLGTMAVIPEVSVARDMARASMLKARAGIHPVKEKKANEAVQQAEAEAEKKTFAWLVEHEENGAARGFIPQYAALRQRPASFAQTRYLLNRVMPKLGPKLLTDIRRSDITEVLDEVAGKRLRAYKGHTGPASAMARALQTCLRTVFLWAYREELLDADPMRKIANDRHGRAGIRDRVLQDDEIRALWAASETLGWPFAQIAKLLLLTGQRQGQVAGMRWSELNLEQRLWTLPSSRTKNKQVHIVPLTDPVIEILESLPRLEGDLVFSLNGKNPVNGFAKTKVRLDDLMREKLGRLDAWVWHDLRRTSRTLLSRAGVRPDISERILGHRMPGLQPTYDRHEYASEKRDALEKLAALVARIVGGNVVLLRA